MIQFNNFLADIYFGHLNKDIFHGFKDSAEDDRARNFIEHYLKISQQYPPRQLEADGRVSSELLEELKSIGFFGLNNFLNLWWCRVEPAPLLASRGGGRCPEPGFGIYVSRPSFHRGEGNCTVRR